MTLREKVIAELEENIGKYVSGEEMARRFSVSRAAVAKCVDRLKRDGYAISSANRMGHCLLASGGVLSETRIRELTNEPDIDITVYKTTDSTSTRAKKAISDGLISNAIFAAAEQTNGRGRYGKSFYSPSSTGLYFSVVLHPDALISDSVAITAAAAVAVCEVIEAQTKKHPQIKWVNDIYIDNKKVCGILTEAVSDFESGRVQSVIIGIGVNLTTEDFPDEIKDIATSVGENIDKNEFIAETYKRLKQYCRELALRGFMDKYRANSLVIGKSITFSRNGVDYTATAKQILDDGALCVVTDGGEAMILSSGEISIKPIF